MMGTTATITTPQDREIRVERIFDAPRDRVFAAFTDPALIPEWWGPYDTTTIVDQMDVRPGGLWRFIAQDCDGRETAFRGVYREVTPPERIVQTFEWEGAPLQYIKGPFVVRLIPHESRALPVNSFLGARGRAQLGGLRERALGLAGAPHLVLLFQHQHLQPARASKMAATRPLCQRRTG